jgi:mRNA interferase MazF
MDKNNLKNSFFKNFTNWFTLKPKLDGNNHKPPLVNIGDIWWCHMGENIGTEISGKSGSFTRPCIILIKFSQYTFFVIPCSSKNKEGSWYVSFWHNSKAMIAVLSQARSVDYRRLQNKMGRLDDADMNNIKTKMKKLYNF